MAMQVGSADRDGNGIISRQAGNLDPKKDDQTIHDYQQPVGRMYMNSWGTSELVCSRNNSN